MPYMFICHRIYIYLESICHICLYVNNLSIQFLERDLSIAQTLAILLYFEMLHCLEAYTYL